MKKLSDQELRDIVASLAVSQKESHKELRESHKEFRESYREFRESHKELRESQKELSEAQKKTDEQMEKTDKGLKELKKTVDKVCKAIGNHTNNVGKVTEEFFYRGFKKRKRLGNVKYDLIRSSVGERQGKEYDIVMVNGDSVAVISVKYKLHEKDIDKFFKEDLKEFKKYFPEFKSYKLYAGIASKSITEKQEKKIKDLGLFAISQAGKDVEVLNEKGFNAKVM